MTERPVIFSEPMVLALLAGTKTMTRRLLYSRRTQRNGLVPPSACQLPGCSPPVGLPGEYYTLSGWEKVIAGDVLWVREAFGYDLHGKVVYRAGTNLGHSWGWGPSIHMPRSACRIFLEVTAMRIERVQSISEADAKAEGVKALDAGVFDANGVSKPVQTFRTGFVYLWNSLHDTNTWLENHWVVVVSFKRRNP